MQSPRLRLFLLSLLALFVELALIRWLGAEIRIFAYFKNLILVACFLGFGAGYYFPKVKAPILPSLAAIAGIVVCVGVPVRTGFAYGPQIASAAFSNYAGIAHMGEVFLSRAVWTVALGMGWTAAIVLACVLSVYGFARRIAGEIEAFGEDRRLEAYSINLAGSLAGILGFAFGSRLMLPPQVWFGGILLCSLWLVTNNRLRGVVLILTAVVAGVLYPAPNVTWSPYQKIEAGPLSLKVNNSTYMVIASFVGLDSPEPRVDRWRLPHTIYPEAKRILIVGAGAGNDASAALQSNVERVVAVEIDPAIYRFGKQLHPDDPYLDPRVEVVLDDARHYAETSEETFDLIVFSHLDSHTSLSGFTNMRLDDYVYTVESIRSFKRLLADDGALYLSFWAMRPWIADRLRRNIGDGWGSTPIGLTSYPEDHEGVVLAHFVATDNPTVATTANTIAESSFEPHVFDDQVVPSTDNWPYLYVQKPTIPLPLLLLTGLILATSGTTLLLLLRKKGGSLSTMFSRHYFFLGAGFLLVEVHNVSRLARVFGTTWSVNAWVITATLTLILVANVIAQRFPKAVGGTGTYIMLGLSLAVGLALPIEQMMGLPLGNVWITLVFTFPFLFAGLIFARSFRTEKRPAEALAANVIGSLVGGLLELASFAIGLNGLLVLAGVLYAASYRSLSDDG